MSEILYTSILPWLLPLTVAAVSIAGAMRHAPFQRSIDEYFFGETACDPLWIEWEHYSGNTADR